MRGWTYTDRLFRCAFCKQPLVVRDIDDADAAALAHECQSPTD